jgi:hypothetical protein
MNGRAAEPHLSRGGSPSTLSNLTEDYPQASRRLALLYGMHSKETQLPLRIGLRHGSFRCTAFLQSDRSCPMYCPLLSSQWCAPPGAPGIPGPGSEKPGECSDSTTGRFPVSNRFVASNHTLSHQPCSHRSTPAFDCRCRR